jgi:hypothetical protein
MTLVTFATESEHITCVDLPSLNSKAGRCQFTLRKRSHENDQVNVSSYNSDFLSGLFADVARVAQSDDEVREPSTSMNTTDLFVSEDSRLDLGVSVKRSRLSLSMSASRCGRSYKNLMEVSSPVGVDIFPLAESAPTKTLKMFNPSCSVSMERVNSLYFQLNCVAPSPKSVRSVLDIIDTAFPHLPATVSDSSCNKQQDLTQTSDQQVSDSYETSHPSKESYGWFVELDDGDDDEHNTEVDHFDPYNRTNSSVDLAFTAPTAPKRVSNLDAEVEWARAADTVDDVLGDFF